jgi:hypothetical protein
MAEATEGLNGCETATDLPVGESITLDTRR